MWEKARRERGKKNGEEVRVETRGRSEDGNRCAAALVQNDDSETASKAYRIRDSSGFSKK